MSVEPRGPGADPVDDAAIVGALQALLSVMPAADLWPDLGTRLATKRQPVPVRRAWLQRFWPLAAAAGLLMALLVLWPQSVEHEAGSSSGGVAGVLAESSGREAAATGAESDLVARSQWLQRLVESPALAPVVTDGDQALLEQGLRARIVGIDAALVDEPEQPQLWRARVTALGELAELRWAGRRAGLASTAGFASEDASLQWIQ